MESLDIDETFGELTKKELYKIVHKLCGSDNIELFIENGSKKGDNFMGQIFRVLFKRAEDLQQKSLIVKIAPKHKTRREVTGVRNLFIREILMYDEVLSFFNEFQQSKGIIPKLDGFNEYPLCYSTISDDMSETVFLEDLKQRQFEIINLREEPVTFEHMSLVFKALGKFHAISFALKDQQTDKFLQLQNLVPEQHWTMLHRGFKNVFEGLFKSLTDCIEQEKRYDLLKKLEEFTAGDPSAAVLKMTADSSTGPNVVICHGDVTTNNSMFRKDSQGNPIEIQIFDWQFCRYASPATDLVVYLICSTTKELRDKHYDDFLKIYHESFSDLLTRLGSDPEKLFPYKALLEQLNSYGAYAVFVAALLLPMTCSDYDSMPDVDKVMDDLESFEVLKENAFIINSVESEKIYNKRVTDMVDDIVRLGYI